MRIAFIKLVVFLSSFLLFQIELIIGKVFLPNFGGSYLIWGACLVFFQATLLAGYGFVWLALRRINLLTYRYVHVFLLMLPLLFFPGQPLALHYGSLGLPLVFDIFLHLAFAVGLVFFVLSTMSIIWQGWLAHSDLPQAKNPYALFGVSNLGSFTALLSYPSYFELNFDLIAQQNTWRLLYLLVIVLNLAALRLIKLKKPSSIQRDCPQPIPSTRIWEWLLYSAGGVMVFMAVTNIVTARVSPVPLLWVIPLAIYLLSFVLNFKQTPWCPGWITRRFPFIIGYGILFYFYLNAKILPDILKIVGLFIFAFFVCMFSQRRLYQSRPQDHRHLGLFYFIVGLGGFVGGSLVTWVVPIISSTFLEYFLALFVILIASQLQSMKGLAWQELVITAGAVVFFWFWPIFFPHKAILPVLILFSVFSGILWALSKTRWGLILFLLWFIIMAGPVESIWDVYQTVYVNRNYYGIHKVYYQDDVRFYSNGSVIHGAQYLALEKQGFPLTYFSPDSPAGELLTSDAFRFKNIAILGLGTGVLATYFNASQNVDFFEIDPDVLEIARKHFTFINRSSEKMRFIIGDARLMLDREPQAQYDLIIIDVFSGDSIPVHLFTREALLAYKRRLKPKGLLLFHMSNRYIDNAIPLFTTALAMGVRPGYKHGLADQYAHTFKSSWVILTWDDTTYNKCIQELKWDRVNPAPAEKYRPFTDTYSAILPYIKWQEFWLSLKHKVQAIIP